MRVEGRRLRCAPLMIQLSPHGELDCLGCRRQTLKGLAAAIRGQLGEVRLRSRRPMTGVRKTRYEIFSGQPEKSCFAVNTGPALLSKNSLHIPTGHGQMSAIVTIRSLLDGLLPRFSGLIFSMALLCAGAVAQDGPRSAKPQTIVFVCLHGSVKSQVATAHFNRIAKERGLPLVAVSRGIAVDPNIPASIRQGLAADGLAPPDDVPVPLASADTIGAIEVFAFDEVPNDRKGSREVTYWSDVPPATKDYVAARDAIVRHIEEAMTSLGKR
jgi:protein-tyrosine-phosphatase